MVSDCYRTIELRMVFSTKCNSNRYVQGYHAFPTTKYCGIYMNGRTSQGLQDKIKLHVSISASFDMKKLWQVSIQNAGKILFLPTVRRQLDSILLKS